MVVHESIEIDCIGHASVKIETADGTVCFIDPWSEVIEPEHEDTADFVFVTHDDRDHYDVQAIEAVSTSATDVIAYEIIDTSELESNVIGLPSNGRVTINDIGVQAVPAYNRRDGNHVDNDGNPYHNVGEVIGLLLNVDGVNVFYPSDTDILDEHRAVRAEVLIPPIGGSYTMDRNEAVDLARLVRAEAVLPIHYDTFEAVETDATQFKADIEALGIEVQLL